MHWRAEAAGEAMAGVAMRAAGLPRAADLVIPPLPLGAARRAGPAPGLSGAAWARLAFIESQCATAAGRPGHGAAVARVQEREAQPI
jgi:hypothetical protein